MGSFLSFLLGEKKKTASVAKERLQIILAHERSGRNASQPDYLPALQRELVAVISKYIKIGPQDIKVRYLVDPRDEAGTARLTGANEPGRHATNVVAGRDFTPDRTIEAADVRAGDPCPACPDGTLTLRRGIEIGHIFQLGRRYTDAFGVDVSGANGKPVRPTMGCYGIGISRAVAAIAEQHHDERGLIWPPSVAPADVHVVAAGKEGQTEAALTLAAELAGAGLRVLVDDRPLSPGVKFTDAELIGIPRAVVVGRRLSEGYAELRDRRSGDRRDVPLAEVRRVIAEPAG